VERHLRAAPTPVERRKGYPKRHQNTEKHYKTNERLWEYPTMNYPYSEQNSKGKVRRQGPGSAGNNVNASTVDVNVNVNA
jgi:hypothetical protein